MSSVASEPAVQRDAGIRCGSLRDGKRAPEDRVRSEPVLGLRAVERDEGLIERSLIVGVESDHRARDLAVDVRHRLEHALPQIRRRIAVA